LKVKLTPATTLALFAVLSIAHTWPLVTDLDRWSRFDNADAQLNAWIVTWVARALETQPLRLFDANIFYPQPDTLAYSEHLFLQSLLVSPLVWLGASPVLASNLVLLSGLTLTGWTTSLVLSNWTGRPVAGIVGGCVAAFNTHLFTRLTHLQALHVEFLPLAFWALDRTLVHARLRDAFSLAAAFVAQSLCSGYLLVLTAVSLVSATLVRIITFRRLIPLVAKRLVLLALAAALSVAALTPFLLPYMRVRAAEGLVRPLDEVASYSAPLPTT
jgi:hypothetical protein